ncbi:hypothetical protein [Winogradskyella bathintestinalis]|uniref:DUF4258 domain-containing protein n=1 Tax=Winogradskyella bathintestinalis TaxID=3035208 RepID=A0ABT7ZXM8_9FLAO|nr:hypothetical protein [Winogradskyella bathintestinalis]MDN3493752.1 hypothetical protein [Winogradskyella bathintestinalis]
MKFIHRLGYYLGGFAIGLVLLMFFLNGKDASCDYGPNARTTKNISSKPIHYSEKASLFIIEHAIDSSTVRNLVKFGDVDFSLTETKKDSCNNYFIENSYKEQELKLKIKNCDSLATLLDIKYTNS